MAEKILLNSCKNFINQMIHFAKISFRAFGAWGQILEEISKGFANPAPIYYSELIGSWTDTLLS